MQICSQPGLNLGHEEGKKTHGADAREVRAPCCVTFSPVCLSKSHKIRQKKTDHGNIFFNAYETVQGCVKMLDVITESCEKSEWQWANEKIMNETNQRCFPKSVSCSSSFLLGQSSCQAEVLEGDWWKVLLWLGTISGLRYPRTGCK